jgi:hypothetical protein
VALTTTIRSVVRRTTAPTAAALAGAAASAAFAVGDVLMLGRRVGPEDRRLLREEPDLNDAAGTLMAVSPDRLRAGGLAGALAAPLHVVSAWSLYDGLSPSSSRRAARIAGTYAAAMAWAGYIHGTFYPWGATFAAADRAEPGTPQRAELLADARRVERSIEIPYAAFGITVAAVAVETAVVVASGRSRFPRWTTPFVTPILPSVLIVAGARALPDQPRHVINGAGLSLGMLTANVVAAATRRPGAVH